MHKLGYHSRDEGLILCTAGELKALWRYFSEMYNLDAFTQSCPADQDIINHYKLQQGTKMTKREELESPSFTNTVPISV